MGDIYNDDILLWSEHQAGLLRRLAAGEPMNSQRIEVAEIYAKALRAMPESIDGQPPLPVPAACPVNTGRVACRGLRIVPS
jgi:dTDP-4-amino-4,6-dideoxygalactose transaminase